MQVEPSQEDQKTEGASKSEVMERLAKKKIFFSKESSEDIASIAKLLLTVTI